MTEKHSLAIRNPSSPRDGMSHQPIIAATKAPLFWLTANNLVLRAASRGVCKTWFGHVYLALTTIACPGPSAFRAWFPPGWLTW